jgi:AbiJ N-terminal domain 3
VASQIDFGNLRRLVDGEAVKVAHAGTHQELPASFARVGLPVPSEKGTKTELGRMSVALLTDDELPEVARRMLASGGVEPGTRNAFQDVLWAADGAPPIPKRTRREIARTLDLDEFLPNYARFRHLLENLWDLGYDWVPFTTSVDGWSLGARIDRHVCNNPGDWTAEVLFEEFGAFDTSDKRFGLFLEGLVSPETLPDEPAQRRVVAAINPHLAAVVIALAETDEQDGYPVFRLRSTRARYGAPKTLIFATPSKPDLRMSDLIDNEVEIVTGAADVLVYDRTITGDGLRWRDLQAWWKDVHGVATDEEAKRTLWRRLRESLPTSSPPQVMLFDLYHAIHGEQVHDLPALLPEVWLHWDPKTVKERGINAMLNLRMDFLMLLPGGHRVVLEVDGVHHYASGTVADPSVYAATMRGDRELKLARYDVFRFGAADLQDEVLAREMLRDFFAEMFRTYNVI